VRLLECTACGWKGGEGETVKVYVCPDCGTGHLKLFRLLKRRDGRLQCPKCTWIGTPEEAVSEPECPKCGNPYLREEPVAP